MTLPRNNIVFEVLLVPSLRSSGECRSWRGSPSEAVMAFMVAGDNPRFQNSGAAMRPMALPITSARRML